jgi:hypothetical protein
VDEPGESGCGGRIKLRLRALELNWPMPRSSGGL